MSFSSALYPGELIIHDTTPEEVHAPPKGMSRGLDLSLKGPEGYAGVADSFPSDLLIDPSEFEPRIKELEERKSRLSDLSLLEGLPCKDQNGTNLCWANGPTHCTEIIRLLQGQSMIIISPASVAGPVNGFRNQGGWGKEALDQIISHGAVPVDKWPANAISKQYYTEENKQLAMNYRVIEWVELEPRNMQQLASLLLRRIPVAVGYNWWSHEITAVDAVWLDGALAIRIRNSWGMGWGDKGFSILQGSKAKADDQVAPRVAIAA